MKIIINGQETTVDGSNVVVDCGKIFIDGKQIELPDQKNIRVTIIGNCNEVKCNSLYVYNGNIEKANVNGTCVVHGDVTKNMVVNGSLKIEK